MEGGSSDLLDSSQPLTGRIISRRRMPKSLQRPSLTYSSSSETEDEVIPTVRKKIKGDPQKMRTPVARSLSSRFYQQLHPSSSSTTITLPKQSTSTQGQLAYEERDAQLDSPVTPRDTNGKKRGHSTTFLSSSITTTESVPTLIVPGPSTSRHSSTPRSHPRQRNLTPSKIIPLLFMEDGGSDSSGSESDVIGSDEVWLGNNALSSSSDEDEGNENDGTPVNLREVFSFDWSEGSDFVPDQHDFRPNRSGTTRDWPCNDEARESAFFRAFIDEEVMSYIAEKTNRYNSWVSQHMDFISPFSRIRNWEATTVRELFVFLALMLIMPLSKKHVLQHYWRNDALISTPLFSKYMPRDRFLLLSSFLHFSDNENPNKEDRIWKVRGFVLDMIVYTGTNIDIPVVHKKDPIGMSGAIVKKMMADYLGRGHILYTDNWYTSPALCQFLHDNKTGSCGTVQANRKFMPKFNGNKTRVENPSSSDTPDSEEEARPHHERSRKRRKTELFIQNITMLNAYNLWLVKKNIDPSKKPKLREFVYNVAYQLLEDFGEPTTNIKGRRPNPMPDRIIDAYSRHYPVHTEMANGKKKPRDCYVCKHTTRRQKKRTRVVIICNECNIGLCIVGCFRDYHTLKNF
ncbi:hypothetical protein Pcinc_001763 [Petrolisthes cinctipes]|uniref:PiggyBac transposable element-derived protein domain-containing protein n=1 Tax=Petrolisthes cinctipes TaxID=88211 RepID=A0AAE1GK57_PETCI|nr:hypothetical protein Pcinc_001763 [Petrolisthes cinctipes]